MNLKRQRGSVTAVIVIVVIIALLGVLGYVFWDKLGNVSLTGNDTQTDKTSATGSSKNLVKASFDKSFGINLSFKYPETWTLSKEQSGTFPVAANETSVETLTVKSPDKKYQVVYRLGANGGLGGTCDGEGATQIIAAETEDLKGWQGAKFMRAIAQTRSDKYVTTVGLVDPDSLPYTKPGRSGCGFGLGVINVPSMQYGLTLLDASIHDGKGTKMNIVDGMSDEGVASEKEARELFSGKTFEEAKTILLSTTLT
jgi:hypothetical protein